MHVVIETLFLHEDVVFCGLFQTRYKLRESSDIVRKCFFE